MKIEGEELEGMKENDEERKAIADALDIDYQSETCKARDKITEVLRLGDP